MCIQSGMNPANWWAGPRVCPVRRAHHSDCRPSQPHGGRVEDEERLATSWKRRLKFRQPWLQLNLITAFVAAFVIGLFEHTIGKVVALTVFLPVLAGQFGNTGRQALAVTLRGLTLGELLEGKTKGLVTKEAWWVLLNGLLVGLTAWFAMYFYARGASHPSALALGMAVFLAMTGSCVVSGVRSCYHFPALTRVTCFTFASHSHTFPGEN